jgi:hypothetical protein
VRRDVTNIAKSVLLRNAADPCESQDAKLTGENVVDNNKSANVADYNKCAAKKT